jgi:hypothetical protein
MSGAEFAMLGAGLALLMISGAWHLGGILLIERVKPDSGRHPHFAVLLTFWCLIILHFSEIAIAAAAYALALTIPGAGSISEGYGDSAGGLLYFSGITFTTLGFTQQTTVGPVRLLAMLQALGGFMLITWSATFVYSIWDERFRQTDDDEEA